MSPGRSYTLTVNGPHDTGHGLRDGQTQQLLGRVVDQKVGDSSRMQVTDSVTNSADFRAR
jgi:hypothetical protein